jgi:hypothetical protein
MLVVIVGLLLIMITTSKISPLQSPEGRSKELAVTTTMHMDALASVDQGSVRLDTNKYKYDVEIQQWSSIMRWIGSTVTSGVSSNGNYIVVTPYDDKGARQEKQAQISPLNSYDPDKEFSFKSEKTSSICITKVHGEVLAKLIKCS